VYTEPSYLSMSEYNYGVHFSLITNTCVKFALNNCIRYGVADVDLTGDICSGTAKVGSDCCACGDSFSDGITTVVIKLVTAVKSAVLAAMDLAMLP
jgi:hypothetical protein